MSAFFLSIFFGAKRLLRYKKPKPFFTSHQSRKASSSTRLVTNDDDDDVNDDKRERGPRKTLSSFRGGGGGGQKAASPSRLRIENSPPFLRRHRVGIHTHKKGRRRYLCDHFDSKDTHTTTRETDCSSHITCVFRGVWDDEEVARPRKAEAWVCDTADDLKDAALVRMTLSLLCRLRRACFLCRIEERERDFFRSTYLLKSSHDVPCYSLFLQWSFLPLSFFLSFFLSRRV